MSKNGFDKTWATYAGVALTLLLAACAQPGEHTAGSNNPTTKTIEPASTSPATQTVEQHVQPVLYRVRRGDSLAKIARSHNVTVSQLVAWNRLKPSARLYRGQKLIVSSPDAAPQAQDDAAVTGAPAPSSANETSSAQNAAHAREVNAEVARHAQGVALMWPAQGNVLEGFQPGETRGIEIGGKAGDPVRAAADGKVMFAGTGLNEYGSLIIVQHNKDFLTAYAHNRRLLVKTGDIVRKGQQIAEMGSENNTRVSVLFELRRDGKPIDPMPYLPQRHS